MILPFFPTVTPEFLNPEFMDTECCGGKTTRRKHYLKKPTILYINTQPSGFCPLPGVVRPLAVYTAHEGHKVQT